MLMGDAGHGIIIIMQVLKSLIKQVVCFGAQDMAL
jgi:hypothetical protein